jgi:hypothetical protein
MDIFKKNRLVNRLRTGIVYLKIDGELYKTCRPTPEDIALSELVFEEVLSTVKFDGLITKDQASNLLAVRGTWNRDDEANLEKQNQYLDDQKIALYKALFNLKQQKVIRRRIKQVNNNIQKLLIRKHSLDHITLENFAETIREDFLLAITIRDYKDNKVYDYFNFWQSDSVLLNKFSNYLNANWLTNEDSRLLARSEPIRSYWNIGKEKMFGQNSLELTNDQKSIILYSRMYDNVYESMERPDDEVIEDDDMLDGWFADQRKKIEEDRKRKEADKILDKKGTDGGGELFVVADSSQEANRIRGLNSLDNQIKINSRKQALKNGRGVEEQDLPDVKLKLQQEAMRQMAQRRGK